MENVTLFLEEAGITEYEITDSGIIFKSNAVFDSRKCIELKKAIIKNGGKLPFKIIEANGDLIMSRLFISNLQGFPDKVHGTLDISSNQIAYLKNCPSFVEKDFIVSNNKKLTTLEFGPTFVGENYDASYCALVNCIHLPEIIYGNLILSDNKIKAFPTSKNVSGDLSLSNNLLIDVPASSLYCGLLIIENNPCNPGDDFDRNMW